MKVANGICAVSPFKVLFYLWYNENNATGLYRGSEGLWIISFGSQHI